MKARKGVATPHALQRNLEVMCFWKAKNIFTFIGVRVCWSTGTTSIVLHSPTHTRARKMSWSWTPFLSQIENYRAKLPKCATALVSHEDVKNVANRREASNFVQITASSWQRAISTFPPSLCCAPFRVFFENCCGRNLHWIGNTLRCKIVHRKRILESDAWEFWRTQRLDMQIKKHCWGEFTGLNPVVRISTHRNLIFSWPTLNLASLCIVVARVTSLAGLESSCSSFLSRWSQRGIGRALHCHRNTPALLLKQVDCEVQYIRLNTLPKHLLPAKKQSTTEMRTAHKWERTIRHFLR